MNNGSFLPGVFICSSPPSFASLFVLKPRPQASGQLPPPGHPTDARLVVAITGLRSFLFFAGV